MTLDVSIMIEGQNGLTWERWERIARAAEDLGFSGLYRSDHFVIGEGEYQNAIETWMSLAWLASNTSRIEFGPLVSPISFRNPSILAWQAVAISTLSGGRLRLGLGAGWNQREHDSFGFELGDTATRFARLEEGIQVIRDLTRSTERSTFEGEYFQIRDAVLKPLPPEPNGLPLVIGGNGPKRTLPLAAKYMDEWNALLLPLDQYRPLAARLDELILAEGRQPSDVKRTMMGRALIGKTEADLQSRESAETITSVRERGGVVGTPSEIVDRLGQLAEAGVQGVMLQWMDLDDMAGLELMASEVLPQLS